MLEPFKSLDNEFYYLETFHDFCLKTIKTKYSMFASIYLISLFRFSASFFFGPIVFLKLAKSYDSINIQRVHKIYLKLRQKNDASKFKIVIMWLKGKTRSPSNRPRLHLNYFLNK
ncbi:hypothetical protein BpHYR1_009178 [Brachionus plicatilis]|uniref:Uncharacterized protein n=1 Tax=Brachionus plicatilis TaxID=10195 RepID=A0A3M7RMY9_BRAPC|nr:hypothetical protein BpHYR1_009178 [Brachionus plicatilis]